MNTSHEENQYTCDKCYFKATQKEPLKKHIETNHEKRQYTCDKCDFKATQKDLLKRHVQSLHSGNENAPNISKE